MIESSEVHISSIVVHVSPGSLLSVKTKIERLRGAEVHGEDLCGKLVVVLESQDESQTTDMIGRISDFPHVISTALVYHQVLPAETTGKESS